MKTWPEMVLVGRIVRPHGNKGHVVIASETDFADARFEVGATVWRETGPLTITAMRMHDGRPIVGFAGFESINDAETLRGAELRVPVEALPALAPGQFWQHDLIGCRVVTPAGEAIGEVVRVDHAATPLLVVNPGETLIPMVDGICESIDVTARTIVVKPLEGLLDANAPGAGRVEHAGGRRDGKGSGT